MNFPGIGLRFGQGPRIDEHPLESNESLVGEPGIPIQIDHFPSLRPKPLEKRVKEPIQGATPARVATIHLEEWLARHRQSRNFITKSDVDRHVSLTYRSPRG